MYTILCIFPGILYMWLEDYWIDVQRFMLLFVCYIVEGTDEGKCMQFYGLHPISYTFGETFIGLFRHYFVPMIMFASCRLVWDYHHVLEYLCSPLVTDNSSFFVCRHSVCWQQRRGSSVDRRLQAKLDDGVPRDGVLMRRRLNSKDECCTTLVVVANHSAPCRSFMSAKHKKNVALCDCFIGIKLNTLFANRA